MEQQKEAVGLPLGRKKQEQPGGLNSVRSSFIGIMVAPEDGESRMCPWSCRKKEFRESWSGAEEWPQEFNPRELSLEEWEEVGGMCFSFSSVIVYSWRRFCQLMSYVAQFRPHVQNIWPMEKCPLYVPFSGWTAFAQPWTWGDKVVKWWKLIINSSHLLLQLSLGVACLCLTILHLLSLARSTPPTLKTKPLRILSTH